MNFEMTLTGVIIILVIYLCVTLFLIYGKNIKLPKAWLFSKGRKKAFIIIDIIVLFIFTLILIFQFDYFIESTDNRNFTFFLISFLCLQTLLDGVEEYLTNKNRKRYYHNGVQLISLLGLLGVILWTM